MWFLFCPLMPIYFFASKPKMVRSHIYPGEYSGFLWGKNCTAGKQRVCPHFSRERHSENATRGLSQLFSAVSFRRFSQSFVLVLFQSGFQDCNTGGVAVVFSRGGKSFTCFSQLFVFVFVLASLFVFVIWPWGMQRSCFLLRVSIICICICKFVCICNLASGNATLLFSAAGARVSHVLVDAQLQGSVQTNCSVAVVACKSVEWN